MNAIVLLEYHRWANGLLTSQIETLSPEIFNKDFGGSFGTIRTTLIHLLDADHLWLTRFKGIPPSDPPQSKTDTAQPIIHEWLRIQDEMLEVARLLTTDPNKTLEFKTRKGQPITMLLTEIITHISHHGSYHRGQVANMIRMSGEKPVGTDYFLWSLTNR
jgi:uncharacterized damage-inducible protein DinB